MELIARFVLLSLFKIVTPYMTSTVIPLKSEDMKANITTSIPSSTTVVPLRNEHQTSYQVTENIKDVPDDRTLAPIIPNFGPITALNLGNNTIAFNNMNKVNANNVDNKTNENVSLKKNSFSIFHIKAEFDDTPKVEHKNVLKKVFGGIKSYVYNLKRGVVDGLHSFFHNSDKPVKETENNFHYVHQFNKHKSFDDVDFKHDRHRSFDDDFGDDHDYYDDNEHYSHFK